MISQIHRHQLGTVDLLSSDLQNKVNNILRYLILNMMWSSASVTKPFDTLLFVACVPVVEAIWQYQNTVPLRKHPASRSQVVHSRQMSKSRRQCLPMLRNKSVSQFPHLLPMELGVLPAESTRHESKSSIATPPGACITPSRVSLSS